jgi:hypothetical protein
MLSKMRGIALSCALGVYHISAGSGNVSGEPAAVSRLRRALPQLAEQLAHGGVGGGRQAAALEGVGHLTGVVAGQHHQRDVLGAQGSHLRHAYLEIAQHFEQKGFELAVGLVNLVDHVLDGCTPPVERTNASTLTQHLGEKNQRFGARRNSLRKQRTASSQPRISAGLGPPAETISSACTPVQSCSRSIFCCSTTSPLALSAWCLGTPWGRVAAARLSRRTWCTYPVLPAEV